MSERRLWIALVALAAALRLFGLADRPFHHDESIHAWFSSQLADQGEYSYDPVYHGPVQYLFVATSFRLFGKHDFPARLPAALGGTALVAFAWLLRPRFGRRAAFLTGALAAVSPTFLYFTRFCREDVWSLLGTAGALLLFDAWRRDERPRTLALAALCLAVAFAAKENFYVFLALLGPSTLAVFWEPGSGFVVWSRLRRLLDVLEKHAYAIGGAILLFFVVSELLYTLGLVHPESGNPAVAAISYWWGQHKVERVGGPKSYYLPRILQYEFAIVIPALVWAFRHRRRLDAGERFLLTLGLSSLGMYAYLGEKTPWLIVHQILPFLPLAGAAWAEVIGSGSRVLRAAGVVTAAASGLSAAALCFWNAALTPARDVAESVVYVQTAPETLALVREIRAARHAPEQPAASVEGEAGWPLNWYLLGLPVDWGPPRQGRFAPIVVVDEAKAAETATLLGPLYVKSVIPLRAWWVPETSLTPLQPTPRELLRYVFTRRPWSIVGSQQVVVFRRTGG